MNSHIKKYFFVPKSLENLIESAVVVIDTNVLLSAYQWKEITFTEVIEKLKNLSETDRLKIPEHVLEEFVHERPKKIKELLKEFNDRIKSKVNSAGRLSSTIPLLGLLPEHQQYIELEKQYNEIGKKYSDQLNTLQDNMRSFFNDDPVLEALKPIFEKDCFTNINKKDSDLLKDAAERKKNGSPPLTGGDSSKKFNEYGDYFVWKDILSLKTDVIFVSNDMKEDWYYAQNNKAFSPRRELIEEFFELNNGNTCCIVNLSEFIEAANPKIPNEVLYDLQMNTTLSESVPKNDIFWAKYKIICVVIDDVGNAQKDEDAIRHLSAIFDFSEGIISSSNIWRTMTESDQCYMELEVNIRATHSAATDAIYNWAFKHKNRYKIQEIERYELM